jgi:hypothetical protein
VNQVQLLFTKVRVTVQDVFAPVVNDLGERHIKPIDGQIGLVQIILKVSHIARVHMKFECAADNVWVNSKAVVIGVGARGRQSKSRVFV